MTELDHSIAAIAASQHGCIARRQLTALGAGKEAVQWRVRRRRLVPVTRDVFVLPGVPASWRQRVWAAHLEVGPRSAACGRTAAHLRGLPGVGGGGIELVLPDDGWARSTLAAVHRTTVLPAHHVTSVDGLPTTTVARCLFELAGAVPEHLRSERGRVVHARRVERVLDTALARRAVGLDELVEVWRLLGGRGRPGSTVFGRLLEERGAGYVPPESELEARFLRLCAEHDLPVPLRQVVLGGDTPVGRVDFWFADEAVVVEVDGRAFHDSTSDRRVDRRRDRELALAGALVLRFDWADVVHRAEATALELRTTLAQRARRSA